MSSKFYPSGSDSGFLLQGGGGREGRPPKRLLSPLNFRKTTQRTMETTAYCSEKQWPIVFPLKFFSNRKPGL